jgi:hypothetical protein
VENISYANNLYSLRADHVMRQAAVPLYTDTIGDVFMHKEGAGWLRRYDGQWRPVDDPGQQARLNNIEAQRQRSLMRQRNFLRQRGG